MQYTRPRLEQIHCIIISLSNSRDSVKDEKLLSTSWNVEALKTTNTEDDGAGKKRGQRWTAVMEAGSGLTVNSLGNTCHHKLSSRRRRSQVRVFSVPRSSVDLNRHVFLPSSPVSIHFPVTVLRLFENLTAVITKRWDRAKNAHFATRSVERRAPRRRTSLDADERPPCPQSATAPGIAGGGATAGIFY